MAKSCTAEAQPAAKWRKVCTAEAQPAAKWRKVARLKRSLQQNGEKSARLKRGLQQNGDINIVEFLLRAYRQWRTVKSAGLKSVLLSKAQPAARNSGAVEISDVRRIWWRIM
jgi:hypothetical protein